MKKFISIILALLLSSVALTSYANSIDELDFSNEIQSVENISVIENYIKNDAVKRFGDFNDNVEIESLFIDYKNAIKVGNELNYFQYENINAKEADELLSQSQIMYRIPVSYNGMTIFYSITQSDNNEEYNEELGKFGKWMVLKSAPFAGDNYNYNELLSDKLNESGLKDADVYYTGTTNPELEICAMCFLDGTEPTIVNFIIQQTADGGTHLEAKIMSYGECLELLKISKNEGGEEVYGAGAQNEKNNTKTTENNLETNDSSTIINAIVIALVAVLTIIIIIISVVRKKQKLTANNNQPVD